MVALRVDLPDELHAKLEKLAHERGLSTSDVVRDVLEARLQLTPRPPIERWEWPTVDLGELKDVPVELWRELANPGGEHIEQAIREGRLDELLED